ncbi:MAG: PilZ domain-containing protein [Deltaproteobacteria bacterium]|nr:PilZ domain-containing protein [Deltaproteobacteria bacterium]MBW2070710.1 PilZ domain-containing protein [Deltaproteobacteria bacterium]
MGPDKRISTRLKLRWAVTLLTATERVEGITRNLSVNGAFVYYYRPHRDGKPLRLYESVGMVLEVPDRLPLLIRAVVVWSDILSSDEGNTLLGVGLHFTDVFYEDRNYLRKIVAQDEKMCSPEQSRTQG